MTAFMRFHCRRSVDHATHSVSRAGASRRYAVCLDVPIPEPASGEVLIRAHAIGVGMPDCLIRAGTYSVMPPLPATPGTELAGVIEKVGPGVTTRQEGQRVYTTARERPHRGGHYAECVATPAEATFLARYSGL